MSRCKHCGSSVDARPYCGRCGRPVAPDRLRSLSAIAGDINKARQADGLSPIRLRKKNPAKFNQPDYTHYVVLPHGEIESGWSYRSDAMDHLREEGARLRGARVLAKRSLHVDPDDDFNWAVTPTSINPAPTPGKKALEMYEAFNGYRPKKVGVFPASFRIPTTVALAGEAVEVLYRSSKLDPTTRQKPKRPIDYIHDHDAGVKVYRTDLEGNERRVPDFITGVNELVLLGECLGLAYATDGEETEMQVAKPYPELYTIPSGKALLVVQDKRHVVALIWGGRLGVEARGIVH